MYITYRYFSKYSYFRAKQSLPVIMAHCEWFTEGTMNIHE